MNGSIRITPLLMAGLLACTEPAPTPSTATATPPPAPAPAAPTADIPADDLVIPERSADYRKMLELAVRYRRGEMTLAGLGERVVAEQLPPHPNGCGYLLMTPPPPPPEMVFDPKLMPRDWKGTFGEVAMMHFAGQLTMAEYETVHRTAHGQRPGFPNCTP